jgi:hypothetical protein
MDSRRRYRLTALGAALASAVADQQTEKVSRQFINLHEVPGRTSSI